MCGFNRLKRGEGIGGVYLAGIVPKLRHRYYRNSVILSFAMLDRYQSRALLRFTLHAFHARSFVALERSPGEYLAQSAKA
jgi:hypothetical protein